MGLFDQFPYTNFHELNLMWILEALKEIQTTTEQFVALNSLKYADPIQWNIVQQYEKNTIVIDPLTGTAYISVQPVPSGVAITNTDYWTVVFDLGSFVTRAAKNFTNRWEEDTTLTATFPTLAGEWLIWGDVLYRALTNITAGDTYVVDSNIEHFTIEELYNAYLDTIANIRTIIGNLDDLNTSDKDSIVNAINNIVAMVGDLDDLNTSDKDSIVNAINSIVSALETLNNFVNPEVPLSTNANTITEAINELFKSSNDIVVVRPTMSQSEIADIIANHHNVYFDGGDYYVEYTANGQTAYNTISNQKIILAKDAVINVVPNSYDNYYVFTMKNVNNVEISGGKIVGDKETHTGATGEWGHAFYILAPAKFIHIHDCEISYMWGDGVYLGESTNAAETVSEVNLDHLNIHHVRRNGISVCEANGLNVENVSVAHLTGGTYPMAGIDFEPNLDGRNIIDCTVSNFIVKDCYRATLVPMVHNGHTAINFENIYAYDITGRMIEINAYNNEVSGVVRCKNYYGENIGLPIRIMNHSSNSFKIEIENVYCHGVEVDTSDPGYYAAMDSLIAIYTGGGFPSSDFGNIQIKNVFADSNQNTYYAFITGNYAKNIKIDAPVITDPSATTTQKRLVCQCNGENCEFNSRNNLYTIGGTNPEVFTNYLKSSLFIHGNHVFTTTDYEVLCEIPLDKNKISGQFPVVMNAYIAYNSGSPTGLKLVLDNNGYEGLVKEDTSGGAMDMTATRIAYSSYIARLYGKNTSSSGNSDYALSIAF